MLPVVKLHLESFKWAKRFETEDMPNWLAALEYSTVREVAQASREKKNKKNSEQKLLLPTS